jgi:succinate dehydrogenase hydrophobic anchor subunit
MTLGAFLLSTNMYFCRAKSKLAMRNTKSYLKSEAIRFTLQMLAITAVSLFLVYFTNSSQG